MIKTFIEIGAGKGGTILATGGGFAMYPMNVLLEVNLARLIEKIESDR